MSFSRPNPPESFFRGRDAMRQQLRQIVGVGAHTRVTRKPMSLMLCDIEGCLTLDPSTYDHVMLDELRRVNEAASWTNALPFLTLCTGRQAHFVEAFCGFLSVRVPAIFEGGCGLYFPSNRPGTRHRWHPRVADETAREYVEFRRIVLEQTSRLGLAPSLGKGRLLTFRVPPQQGAGELARELSDALSGTPAAVTHSADSIDIAPSGLSKAAAIPWLLEAVQEVGGPSLAAAQLAGIGDAPNDAAFLETVGHSFAPSNADADIGEKVAHLSVYSDAKAVAEAVSTAIQTNIAASSGRRHRHRPTSATGTLIFAVDSGGGSTRLAIRESQAQELTRIGSLPSLNPASSDDPAESWIVLLGAIADYCRDGELGQTMFGCIASSSVSPETVFDDEQRLRLAASTVGLTGRVRLVNDAVSLLLAPPLNGVGTVAVVGTGTVFWRSTAAGEIRRASGLEYAVSDEGGAFFIGQEALRAATRARDGRGRPTMLLDAVQEHFRTSLAELARDLAAKGHFKSEVACLAPAVCTCAREGDESAIQILRSSSDCIAEGMCAVLAGEDATQPIIVTGGVWNGCKELSGFVRAALRERHPEATLTSVPDCLDAAVHLAAHEPAQLSSPVVVASVELT